MLKNILAALVAAALPLLAAGAAWAGPKVRFETTLGGFTLELDEEKAPKTVANFLQYVDDGHYDGVVFHRVIPNFMAQGGGFEAKGGAYVQKETRASIENEADNGLKNARGSIAMARTNDPHSAGAQFFINFKDNDFLNHSAKTARGWGYAVFGRVIEGMETVDAMAGLGSTQKTFTVRTQSGSLAEAPFSDVPITDVVITSAKRVE